MKTILFALCLFIASPVFGASRHADGDYVIILNGNESPEVVRRQHGVGRRPNRDKTWSANNGFHGFSAHLTGAQADRLESDTRVAVIEPDAIVQLEPTIPGVTGIGVSGPVTSRYGGTGSDGGHAVTVDKAGNIYAAGWFGGSATFGTTTLTSAGGQDLWITKTDPMGTLLWVKGYGGTGDETVTSIAVGIDGSVYLGGYFTGTGNFGGTNCVTHGGQDIFIAKYSNVGAHVWSESFGSTDLDALYGLAVDASGNVYCTGTFRQTINFGGGVLNSILGGDTGYLAKFDTTGAYVLANRFNGTSSNYGRAIALDSSGNILIAGYFNASINLGGGSLTTPGSAPNLFVGKFTSGGVYTWQIAHGDTHTTRVLSLAVDPSGNAIVGGEFNTSTDLGGGTITSSAIYLDTFIARYASANGAYQWGVRTAGNLQTQIYGLASDPSGNISATGYLYGNTTIAGIALSSSVSSYDILLIRVNASGSVISAQIFGSSGTDQGYAVAVDASGHPIITGNFQGTLTANGTSITSAGSYDAFLLKLGQIVPTGVSRIGTLLNTTAHIAGIDVNRVNADVAVIDSGIQLSHPDLNVYANVSFVTGTSTGNDDFGHGTHVAGIIGALDNQIGVVGVAPGARLWAVKVLDSTGSGTLSAIISGVDYVTQHSAEIEVANMSLGGNGLADSLRLAIQNSVSKGVVYVVAAGNNGADLYGGDWIFGTDDDFFPASYPEVATISALADSDGIAGGVGTSMSVPNWGTILDDTLATFSNYGHSVIADNPVFSPGASIDVAAPGVNIYSTYTNSTYTTMSGTSMAAPHVTGAVALYCASTGRASDTAGVTTIRQAIIDLAEPQSEWGINPTNPRPNNDHNPEGLLSVLRIGQTWTPTGNAPVVAISSPTAGATYTSTNVITFTGTATDVEDGTLTAGLVWNSSIQGQIGIGATFTSTLTNGTHVITARVTDSDGNVGYKSVGISVTKAGNTPPTLTITAPTNNAALPVGIVTFTGVAKDTEDGTISSAIKWYYGTSLLGTGASIPVNLGTGSYTIQARVTDSGLLSTTNSVSFTVVASPPANTPPAISITAPTNGVSIIQGTSVTFTGTATDAEDGNLTAALIWTDSVNGALGTGGTVNSSTLSAGAHTTRAKVTDSGSLSTTNSVSYTIIPRPAPVITVTCPTNGANLPASTVLSFTCTAADAIDGDVKANVWWYLQTGTGPVWMGTGTPISIGFIQGNYSMSLLVTNTASVVGSAQVNFFCDGGITNTPPNVGIQSPANGASFLSGTPVILAGTSQDDFDGNLSASLAWSSSLDGALGTGAVLTNSTLAVGSHTITATSIDSGTGPGTTPLTNSASVGITIFTNTVGVATLVPTITTDYVQYYTKQKARITCNVKASGTNVPNVSVNMSLRWSNAGISKTSYTSGLTDSSGNFLWIWRVPATDVGTNYVAASVSKTGFNSAATSLSFKSIK